MSVITDGPARASAARSDTWTRTTRGLADACGLALMIFILATIALGELPLPVQRGAVLLLGAAAILFSTPTLPATWRSGRTGRLADRALTIVFLAAILAAMRPMRSSLRSANISFKLAMLPAASEQLITEVRILCSVRMKSRERDCASG